MLSKFLENVKIIDPNNPINQGTDSSTSSQTYQEQIKQEVIYGPKQWSEYYFSAYFTNKSRFMKDIFQLFSSVTYSIYLKIDDQGMTFFNFDSSDSLILFTIPRTSFKEFITNFNFVFSLESNNFLKIFSRFEIKNNSNNYGFTFSFKNDRLIITQKKDNYRTLSYSLPLSFSDRDFTVLFDYFDTIPAFSFDMDLKTLAEIIRGNPRGKDNSTIELANNGDFLDFIISPYVDGVKEIINTPFKISNNPSNFSIPYQYAFFNNFTKKFLKKTSINYLKRVYAGIDENNCFRISFTVSEFICSFTIMPRSSTL